MGNRAHSSTVWAHHAPLALALAGWLAGGWWLVASGFWAAGLLGCWRLMPGACACNLAHGRIRRMTGSTW